MGFTPKTYESFQSFTFWFCFAWNFYAGVGESGTVHAWKTTEAVDLAAEKSNWYWYTVLGNLEI